MFNNLVSLIVKNESIVNNNHLSEVNLLVLDDGLSNESSNLIGMPRDERFQVTALVNVHVQRNLSNDAAERRTMRLDVLAVLEFTLACATN